MQLISCQPADRGPTRWTQGSFLPVPAVDIPRSQVIVTWFVIVGQLWDIFTQKIELLTTSPTCINTQEVWHVYLVLAGY